MWLMNLFGKNRGVKNFYFRRFRPNLRVRGWERFPNLFGYTCCQLWNLIKCYVLLNPKNHIDLHSPLIIRISLNPLFGRLLQEVKSLLHSFLLIVLRIEMLLLRLWPLCCFCKVTGSFCSPVRGELGHFALLASTSFCVGCFASIPLEGSRVWSVLASWLGIMNNESACPLYFPLRRTISYSKTAGYSSQRTVKPSGSLKLWNLCKAQISGKLKISS